MVNRMQQEEQIEKIEEIIERIRPYLNSEGGDIEFVKFENGIVYVKMLGACVGCMMIDDTLKGGIESMIVDEVPGVIGVENVTEDVMY